MRLGDTTKPKARKSHLCWWCAEEIVKGETYAKWVWCDPAPMTLKAHLECLDVWETLGWESDVEFGQYPRARLY